MGVVSQACSTYFSERSLHLYNKWVSRRHQHTWQKMPAGSYELSPSESEVMSWEIHPRRLLQNMSGRYPPNNFMIKGWNGGGPKWPTGDKPKWFTTEQTERNRWKTRNRFFNKPELLWTYINHSEGGRKEMRKQGQWCTPCKFDGCWGKTA